MQVPLLSGAVYKPAFGSTLPQEAVKVAGRLVVNCCVPAWFKLGFTGEMVSAACWPIVSRAVLVYAVSLSAVAVIWQISPAVAGAV